MKYPTYLIEDGRAADPDANVWDRAVELEVLGSHYTYHDILAWQYCDAYLVRYYNGERHVIGAVDDILNGRIRPPLEANTYHETTED